MSYGIEIRQTVATGLEQEESLAKYKATLQALVKRFQGDDGDEEAAGIDPEDVDAASKFLKKRGITVRWFREK